MNADKKIKILHITTVSGIGGTENMLLSLLDQIDRTKFEFLVASLYGDGPLSKRVRACGVRYFDLKLKQLWLFPWRLYRLISLENVDIVQVYGITADVVVRPLAKIFGARILISSIRSSGGPKKWYRSCLARFASSQVDFWISNSVAGRIAASEKNEAPYEKIVVIHNGISSAFSQSVSNEQKQKIRRDFGFKADDFVVLTVANIRRVKRHVDILRAIVILRTKGLYPKFCFVGADKSNGKIETMAEKMGVVDQVYFAGFRDDLATFYSLSDIFLLTSEWEGLPGSIMGAMAYGLPVIATKVGGVPELIRDGKEGQLIPPKTPQAIAESIEAFYKNAIGRQRLGQQARVRVTRDFTLGKMIAGLQRIYADAWQSVKKVNTNHSIKILRIIARLNIGGPAIQAIRLTSELSSDKFNTLLTVGQVGKNEGDMAYLADQWGVNPVIIPELGREIHWWDDLIALRRLVCIIRDYKPKIVHTHTAKAGTLGRLAALVTRVPFRLHTFHGHVFDGYFSARITRLFISIERLLAHYTTQIIAISPSQKRDLSERFSIAPPRKFSIIPLGLDLEKFISLNFDTCGARKKLRLQVDRPVVSIVGRLVAIKNHCLFLKCAQLLSQSATMPVQFMVVGDGELRAELEQLAGKTGLSEWVHFVGWQMDVASVYQASDVVVSTSLNEGTPVSLIEAMAAAKPVVATAVGGVRDVVTDGVTGFLVPSEDVELLAEKVVMLLENRKLAKQIGENARKFVATKYVTERLVRDVSQLYLDLISKNCQRNYL